MYDNRGYRSHIEPDEPVEAYMYPLHLILDAQFECIECGWLFRPESTSDEEIEDTNRALKQDVISFLTTCPHCGVNAIYEFTYSYDE